MESIRIIQYISFILICFGIFGCSNDLNEMDQDIQEAQQPYISATIGTKSLPADLRCDLYIFWKSSGETDYYFKEESTLIAGHKQLKFMNNDLKDKDYKFLFVATSSTNPEIRVTNLSNTSLSTTDKWEDVLISANELLLSAENYSGVLDKTGDEILNDGTIHGTLTHIVGQLVLDIFRINGNISNPMDIESADVTSVLDRVFKVDIEYSGITRDIVFSGSNSILDNNMWLDEYTETHSFNIGGDFKVSIPQEDNGLFTSPANTLGSVRMKGIYCLPSTENMKIKYTFHYYDTTPACGNDHAHTTGCYEIKTLVLNLPEDKNDATLLSVYPNYLTVNKAGIRYDRIIDVGANVTLEFNTKWKNDGNI